jgi:hypothetical protein
MVDRFGNIINLTWTECMIQKISKDTPTSVSGGFMIGYNYAGGGKLYRFKTTNNDKSQDAFYTDIAKTNLYAKRIANI